MQLLSAATVASDVYWFSVSFNAANTSGAYRSHRIDIGVDNAGGSSYTVIINDIIASSANAYNTAGGGVNFIFPMFIKAGSTVAARTQSNVASATIRCVIEVFGKPSAPHLVNVGAFSETIGLGTAPAATPFTPGTSGAEGSWVSLGTTTNDLWWFQLCVQNTSTLMSTLAYNFDLAYGDVSNKVMIIENKRIVTTTGETIGNTSDVGGLVRCQQYVPAGSTLYVRGACHNIPTSGWEASCVGVG